jgi:hypothetical protein
MGKPSNAIALIGGRAPGADETGPSPAPAARPALAASKKRRRFVIGIGRAPGRLLTRKCETGSIARVEAQRDSRHRMDAAVRELEVIWQVSLSEHDAV